MKSIDADLVLAAVDDEGRIEPAQIADKTLLQWRICPAISSLFPKESPCCQSVWCDNQARLPSSAAVGHAGADLWKTYVYFQLVQVVGSVIGVERQQLGGCC